jgi:hypothetical protein
VAAHEKYKAFSPTIVYSTTGYEPGAAPTCIKPSQDRNARSDSQHGDVQIRILKTETHSIKSSSQNTKSSAIQTKTCCKIKNSSTQPAAIGISDQKPRKVSHFKNFADSTEPNQSMSPKQLHGLSVSTFTRLLLAYGSLKKQLFTSASQSSSKAKYSH